MTKIMNHLLLFFTTFTGLLSAQTNDWVSLPSTVDDDISCAVEYDGKLIVAGKFTYADTVESNAIAAFDGTEWSALGSGLGAAPLPYPYVYIENMLSHNGKLYIVGQFEQADGFVGNNIAVWDGNTWDNMNGGADERVFDIGALGDEIFVTGFFDSIGGVEAHRTAKWDGEHWHSMDTIFGYVNGNSAPIIDFHRLNGKLYASGTILEPSGASCGHTEYDGTNWTCGSPGLIFHAPRLGNWGDILLTGSTLLLVNNQIHRQTHVLNDTNWEVFSSQQTGTPATQVFVEYSEELYMVGGLGLTNTDTIQPRVVKWDGTTWQKVGTGISSVIEDAIVYNGELYIVGGFSEERSASHNFIAKLAHNVGLDEEESLELSLYPNPVTNVLSIEFTEAFQGILLFSDISGRVLNNVKLDKNVDTYQMDVSAYSSGIYILDVVKDQHRVRSDKVIINSM